MKKIIFLLAFFGLLLTQDALSQPLFYFSPEEQQVDEGETVCLDLKVQHFTDIISMQFTIAFDPEVLQYTSITNFNTGVPGLDIADFGVTTANLGYITFIWSDGQPCQSATSAAAPDLMPDHQVLFSLCFEAIGDYGNHTPVEIIDSPIDRITRRATAQCFDIGENIGNGFVSIGTSPLKVHISSADGYPGDVICVDFKVEDFNDLVSMQYYIFWDTAVLEYFSSMKMTLGNAGDQYSINYAPAFGMLIGSWFNTSVTTGVDLADGTSILQMCFKIKGECGESSPIYFDTDYSDPDHPSELEVIDAVTQGNIEGTNIGLRHTPGTVTVKCNDPDGLTINMADKNICPGEMFEVDVRVEDFDQIAQLTFDLKWNPSVIQYQSATVPTQPGSANCVPFSNGFDDSQALSGVFTMDWETQGQGCNKPDGYIIIRLKFIAIGPSGSNTTIAVVDPIFVDKFGGVPTNIGINNNNSFVSICQLDNPTIVAGSGSGNPGTNVCIDFTVQDFEDITSMGYTLYWEPSLLQFTGVQGFNLAGLDASNFNTSQAASLGIIGVNWADALGASVPDGVSIFTLCFDLLGDPNDCSVVEITDTPWPIEVETTTSNATNVGLNEQPGQICVDDPFIFNISIPEVYSGQFSNICVDVSVNNFNQLTNTEYSINWNPNILELTGLMPLGNLPNFTASSYDISNANDGNLTIDWAAVNQILGTSVPDGTAIFELCFNVMGVAGECSPIAITSYPDPTFITSATTGNANLSLGADIGSICVSGAISLASYTVTDVSCGGTPNGAISIVISGGSGQYSYQWTGPGVNPTAAGQTNLNIGSYAVTITDALNPALKVIQPFNINYTVDATYANAGRDTSFSCGNFFLTLDGTGSSAGPNTTYQWQALGNGIIIPGQQDTITPQVIGGNNYKLTVTGPGCVDTDTVHVASAQIPVPYIDSLPDTITCIVDTVLLDGSLSAAGYDVMWTGPGVVSGTESFLTPKVTEPGTYILTLSSPVTGCMGTDTVEVLDERQLPTSDAGADDILGCNDSSVPIGGANSSTGPNFIYDWVPIGGGQLCGNPQALNISACSGGIFQLTVTDTLNGCTAVDEVEVMQDTLKPLAMAGLDTALNCTVDVVTLDGTGSSVGNNFSYTWTNLENSTVVSQTMTATITSAGNYQLEVLNTDNGCSTIDQVLVDDDLGLPQVEGAASNAITCAIDTSTLDATGSATGTNIGYSWSNATGTIIGNTLQHTVTQPGTYLLTVTNNSTTCSDTMSVTVIDNTTPPASNAGANKAINCYDDEPTLDGIYDSNNPNLVIQWTGPGTGCLQGANTPNPTVSCTGSYVMQVVDTVRGCVGFDTVEVVDDETPPSANAGPDMPLPCAGSSVILQGSTNATNFEAAWTVVTGNGTLGDPTILTPTATQVGTYSLVVTNTDNGCTSVADLVTVTQGNSGPIANAGADATVDCQNQTATLDGSGSTPGVSYLWEEMGGGFISDQVTATVPQGTYVLTVTANNDCEATDTVTVTNIAIDIQATATASGEISCESASVELTGSSNPTGPTLSFVWTNSGGLIVGNGQAVTVTTAGTYTLTVSDSDSFCSDTAQVTVNFESNLEAPNAQVEYTECESDATLTGNLPANATGVWTSPTGATFADPNSPTTTASNLSMGENLFIWTLSLGECIDYAADSATVILEVAQPDAMDDNTTLLPGTGGQLTFNVLENDNFVAGAMTFSLLPFEGFGEVSASDSGVVTFVKERCFVGNVAIPYEICDLTCPDLCSEATLTIDVLPDGADGCDEIPNGITPNGDGVNDALVFDVLLDITHPFPDNEIIIFNRWGDVVYQAKPYNNDWQGTNDSGDDLPHATYYYVLRLNIAAGDIIKGDVTIIK